MKKTNNLRKQAEKKLKAQEKMLDDMAETDVRKLAHELQVHQVELELQNEELGLAQQELARMHNRFVDLYDFAPAGYLTLDEKGMILEANLTFADMLGIERGKLIKRPLSAFISADDQGIYYLHHKEFVKTEKIQICEFRIRRKDSSIFWARLEGRLIKTRFICLADELFANEN